MHLSLPLAVVALAAVLANARTLQAQTVVPQPSKADKLSPMAVPPDWSTLLKYSGSLTSQEFDEALTVIYSAAGRFPVPWVVGPDGVDIQTGQSGAGTVRVEFLQRGEDRTRPSRYWRGAKELPALDGRPPLSDVHIAIDPGHIGGGFGKIEERHLSMAPGEAIQEGDLTLLTAQILERRLKDLGAYVTLVRNSANPVTPKRPEEFLTLARSILRESGFEFPEQSYVGLEDSDKRILTVQWQSEKLFYRVAEIRARAQKVNEEIKPDVVLCLHFNAEAWGDPENPEFSPKNHLHLMLNGCYSAAECSVQDVRFEMMQRLFSGVWQEELALIDPIARSMAIATRLPPFEYATPNARRVSENPYVYARNLLANRLFQCPVIYFEPYVMNHEETYRRLLLGHWVGRTRIGDSMQTSPIEDYVQGIVRGLLDYYTSNRPS